jgi:hypothetical protein
MYRSSKKPLVINTHKVMPLIEKLIVAHLFKKLLAFYLIYRLVSVLTRSHFSALLFIYPNR